MPARCGSPSCSRPSSSSIRQPASTASSGPGRRSPGRGHLGRRRRAARPSVPSAAISARAARRCGSPRSTPSSSASVCSTRRSGERIGVSAPARTAGSRPSQLTKEPAFSATGATGKTTSARAVTADSPQLEAHHEAGGVDGGQRGVPDRAGRRGRRRRPAARRGHRRRPRPGSSVVSRPGCGGQLVDVPGGRDLLARSRDPPTGGRRAAGSAGSRRPARRAPRPGAESRPAGPRCDRPAASPPTVHRRLVASRSPTRMIAPGCDSSVSSVSSSGVEGSGLAARRGRDHSGAQLGRTARWRTVRSTPPAARACGRPCAAAGRRSAIPPRARTRPAPPPARSPGRRSVTSTAARRRGRPGTAASSAECGRARKSMSLVPSTIRANFA